MGQGSSSKPQPRPLFEVPNQPPMADTENECDISEDRFGDELFLQHQNNMNEMEFAHYARVVSTLAFKSAILSQSKLRLDTKRHLTSVDRLKLRNAVAVFGHVQKSVEEAFPQS